MDLSRAEWHKASRSSSNGGNCVEVARNLRDVVAVRDSKNPDGPVLIIGKHEWASFTARLRADA
jgi:hypothetical protein